MPLQSSRQSLYHPQSQHQTSSAYQQTSQTSASNSSAMSSNKARQYAHLHSQLAQLNAHLADTENLVRVTTIQSGDLRFLGGYVGAMLMGSAKILGEESMKGKGEEEASGNGTVESSRTSV